MWMQQIQQMIHTMTLSLKRFKRVSGSLLAACLGQQTKALLPLLL